VELVHLHKSLTNVVLHRLDIFDPTHSLAKQDIKKQQRRAQIRRVDDVVLATSLLQPTRTKLNRTSQNALESDHNSQTFNKHMQLIPKQKAMCKPPVVVFDSLVGHTDNIGQQKLLLGLVETIEHAAQDMLHHAAEAASSDVNQGEMPPLQQEASAAPSPFVQQQANEYQLARLHQQHATTSFESGAKMPALPSAAAEQQMHNRDDDEPEEPKRKRRKRRNSSAKMKDPMSTEKGHKRSFVEHHYHDHSNDLPGESEEMQQPAKSRGGITTPFPMQLHDMLQHAEGRGYSDVVSWQPHGRAFHVHDPARFVGEVMPMFFRQTRMSSFQRQLSLYGFLRLTRKGEDHGGYYHELFLRGMPHLCHRMQRTRIKGYWVRQSSSPETEPDFSKMSVVGTSSTDRSTAAFPRSLGFPQKAAPGVASQPTSNLLTTAGGGIASNSDNANENSFWNLSSERLGNPPGTKVEPSLNVESTLGSGGVVLGVPTSAGASMLGVTGMLRHENNKIKVPPMPPLGLATAATTTTALDASDNSYGNFKSAPTMPNMLGGPQQSFVMSGNNQLAAATYATAPQDSPQDSLHEASASLEAHFGDMSPLDREDLVTFLSDVDLTSGDENSVDESYQEEAKIGQVESPYRKRRIADV